MKRRFRLRRQREFQQALGAERVFVGRALVAFARPRQSGGWRVGVAVSRQLSGSVRRNRARRRIREAARARLLTDDSGVAALGKPYDVVLIARPPALNLPQTSLEAEAEAVRSRLVRP